MTRLGANVFCLVEPAKKLGWAGGDNTYDSGAASVEFWVRETSQDLKLPGLDTEEFNQWSARRITEIVKYRYPEVNMSDLTSESLR